MATKNSFISLISKRSYTITLLNLFLCANSSLTQCFNQGIAAKNERPNSPAKTRRNQRSGSADSAQWIWKRCCRSRTNFANSFSRPASIRWAATFLQNERGYSCARRVQDTPSRSRPCSTMCRHPL